MDLGFSIQDSGPDVDPEAEEDLARVDPDGLEPDPAQPVPDEVEREQLAPLQGQSLRDEEKYDDLARLSAAIAGDARAARAWFGLAAEAANGDRFAMPAAERIS